MLVTFQMFWVNFSNLVFTTLFFPIYTLYIASLFDSSDSFSQTERTKMDENPFSTASHKKIVHGDISKGSVKKTKLKTKINVCFCFSKTVSYCFRFRKNNSFVLFLQNFSEFLSFFNIFNFVFVI